MVKFFYQPFQNKQFWSNKRHEYYNSINIRDQIWDSPEHPCKGECLDIYNIIKILPKNATKATRSAIMRFPTDVFPLKEYIGYEQWNGIIFIDLDFIKSKIFCDKIEAVIKDDKLISYNKEKCDRFYSSFKDILFNIANDNLYYIERSSSYIGVHIMLYFNVNKTRDNFLKCAEYCKNLLLTKIIDNDYAIIKDFDKILNEPHVFDPIYNRIYQKCYITGIECFINSFASGNIDEKLLDN